MSKMKLRCKTMLPTHELVSLTTHLPFQVLFWIIYTHLFLWREKKKNPMQSHRKASPKVGTKLSRNCVYDCSVTTKSSWQHYLLCNHTIHQNYYHGTLSNAFLKWIYTSVNNMISEVPSKSQTIDTTQYL